MDARLARILEIVPLLREAKAEMRKQGVTDLSSMHQRRAIDAKFESATNDAADLFHECMGLMDELTDDMGIDTLTAFCDFAFAISLLEQYTQGILRKLTAGLN